MSRSIKIGLTAVIVVVGIVAGALAGMALSSDDGSRKALGRFGGHEVTATADDGLTCVVVKGTGEEVESVCSPSTSPPEQIRVGEAYFAAGITDRQPTSLKYGGSIVCVVAMEFGELWVYAARLTADIPDDGEELEIGDRC